jgi:hypothetical protein
MALSGDLILHMRMNGCWHLYRPGERWQRPARDMRIVLATARAVAVGFNIPVAELQNRANRASAGACASSHAAGARAAIATASGPARLMRSAPDAHTR